LLPGNGNAKIKTFYKLRVVCGQEEGATLNVLRIALRFAMATDRNIGPSTSATAISQEQQLAIAIVVLQLISNVIILWQLGCCGGRPSRRQFI